MLLVLAVIQILIAIALIAVILIQRSEGGGLGIGGGGGSMGGFMTARGTSNLLTRVTAILAALFLGICLVLAVLGSGPRERRSFIDTMTPTAPSPSIPPSPASPNHAPAPAPAESAPAAPSAPLAK
jgi:preprotein translocase subunit SecG